MSDKNQDKICAALDTEEGLCKLSRTLIDDIKSGNLKGISMGCPVKDPPRCSICEEGETAYLLMLCERTSNPPYIHFIEAGVYSERHPSPATPWHLHLYMTEDTGNTFEEAEANVLAKAKAIWGVFWVTGVMRAIQ